jgi:3-hydroxyacyl-CoA dehydrogenase
MTQIANWSRTGPIAVLTFDNPPVNAISQAVRSALLDGVNRANAEADVSALVIACAGQTFFAGADLREFNKPPAEPLLPEVVDALQACAKPVIAAIHGTALGGGLEIAMGCHYRVATTNAKLGLAVAAHEAGLVDVLTEGDLLEATLQYARGVAGKPPRRTRDLTAAKTADAVYDAFLQRHAKKLRGLDAPPAIITSIRAATELPYEEGGKRERELFLKLRAGPQSAGLRHAFFAEREAAKLPGVENAQSRAIQTAGVIGSGTMGSGIAIALLSAGLPVTLYERDASALERGGAHIRKTLADNVKSGRMSQKAADDATASLRPTANMNDLTDVDIVIEAAYETMEVKQDIFAALDKLLRPGAVLATNTSYLDIDAIAAITKRPADVIGLHFFSPANVMKLLEVVRGAKTAPDVIATGFALAKRLRKIAVLSGNAWGFIGNRMLAVRRREAEAMAVEGASPSQIDGVFERFGVAMGPFRVSDLSGIDIGWSPETSTGKTIRERLCEAGRRGQKSGAGFYDYDENRKPSASDAALKIIADFARDQGVKQRAFNDEEILDRLIWPMVDEGAQLLADGIALRESDIDVVWLNGYGWPTWTGGPMFYARQTGLREVVRRLEALGRQPSDALRALAAETPA